MDNEIQIVTLLTRAALPACRSPVCVAPNVEVVDLLRHRLGSPEAVWTE